MVAYTDMEESAKTEVMEIATNACEKYLNDNQSVNIMKWWKIIKKIFCFLFKAAQMIKEALDKRFGTTWHVVVGEGFGFDISYEISRLFYMFFAGNLGVCAWKCSSY